jgi:HEPN domain-containing protein
MTSWNKETLRALDLEYAEQGVHLHQRPFRAALDILGSAFSMGVGGNPEVQKIMAAYAEMIPEVDANWPGMGIGLAAVVDQVRRVVVPVLMGGPQSIEVWRGLGFADDMSWWLWCRENEDHGARTSFAFADLHDFTYGLEDMRGGSGAELTLWKMATSNLADAANNLPTTFSVDSVLQPICMTAELSLKAALVRNGASPKEFKGKNGHDLKKLVDRLAAETPHRDDALARNVVAHLPPYVQSRYAAAGLNRLQVVRLAVGVQFLAASTVRRFSDRDIASQMESGGWPAPRRPFFTS